MNVYIIGRYEDRVRIYSTFEKAKDCINRIYGVNTDNMVKHDSHGPSWSLDDGWWITEEEVR
jgi:hypothetical protein